jgi:MscS family membrane protein
LFVIGERRFNVGDWILVDGLVEGMAEGIVEVIGFRTTTIRRFDECSTPHALLHEAWEQDDA